MTPARKTVMRILRPLSLLAGAALLATATVAFRSTPAPGAPALTVYHSPTCGCCRAWVDYLKANGFEVKSIEQDDMAPVKDDLGVPAKMRSCHTAVVGTYIIEGHVPAADIRRLLKEKPKVAGLAAPGMPGASPGMDTGKEPYDVLAFDLKGGSTVWAKH